LGKGRLRDLFFGAGTRKEKEEVTFLKKSNQKTFIPPAFEWPKSGRSKAGDDQKFFGYFFSKK
jgi:hypothetical protein